MKTKLTIIWGLMLIFISPISFAQEKSGQEKQKWRMIYNENKEPIAIGLSSNNSATFNGEVVRLEVIFYFKHAATLMFPDGFTIRIRTGDKQLIGAKTVGIYCSIDSRVRFGDDSRKVAGSIYHTVIWDEKTKMYDHKVDYFLTATFNGWPPEERKDYGGKLNYFFGLDSLRDKCQILNSLKSFLLNDIESCKMEFRIEFPASNSNDDTMTYFYFDRTGLPEQYSKELWALVLSQLKSERSD